MNVRASSSAKGEIALSARSFNTNVNHEITPVYQTVTVRKGDNPLEMELPMGQNFLTWDEFSPALYR